MIHNSKYKPYSKQCYHIDARTSTAKKSKRGGNKSGNNNRNNNTSTPISHSVSYNHHKYEIEDEHDKVKIVQENRKLPMSNKQMKMMVRCMQSYCGEQNESTQSVAQKYALTAKIFDQLQKQYELVGREEQVRKNKELLEHITPGHTIRCDYCQSLGRSCNQYQEKMVRKKIQGELDELQLKLLKETRKKEELLSVLASKGEYENGEGELQELRRIEQLQKNILATYLA